MKLLHITLLAIAVAMLAACSRSVPEAAASVDRPAAIWPDYDGATIPCNIAPMNFIIREEGKRYRTHVHAQGADGFVVSGRKVEMPAKEWRRLLAPGGKVLVDVYVDNGQGWTAYKAIEMPVAEEIDPYISYRLIEPSYVNFEKMRLSQRCLENFDERDIINNCAYASANEGQCMNCHSYQDYNRQGNMQFHVRVTNGGTVIVRDGQAVKVNLKAPGSISAGVYPSWHPELPIIAYSQNSTSQIFHYADRNKVEVQDDASDIVLYDCETNAIAPVACDSTQWETFPYWNHDGTALYYVSALVDTVPTSEMPIWRKANYKDIKYNIFRKPFDPATRQFGAADTVFMASEMGRSATFPRESRDGRFLLFTLGDYGTFHIWHHDADLWLLDLQTMEARPLDEVNSPDTESYHSFSSNGRWIIFSSRRDDGNYTRLYIAHFDENGRAGKPFILPQRDPEHNTLRMLSYNVPEFMAEPVKASRRKLEKAIDNPPIQAKQ